MLISCKCLNFIASYNDKQYNPQQPKQRSELKNLESANAAVEPEDTYNAMNEENLSRFEGDPALGTHSSHNNGKTLSSVLMEIFHSRYPRNFIFYSQFMEFFKQSIGPISELSINAINQRDLIYSITIDIPFNQSLQTWQVSLCINCNVALCARRLQVTSSPTQPQFSQIPQFLINQSLLTSNEELGHRRADISFSETFGIRIMDHPEITNLQQNITNTATANNIVGTQSLAAFTIGSLSSTTQIPIDAKQLRLRQLHVHLQQRLKREIAETNERIQRYTEQQFALLKIFREKSEQEYELLVNIIQNVPEQNGSDLMDRIPPILEVSAGAVNYLVSRRRNTIGSRRDLNSVATAPTTPITPSSQFQLPPNFLALPHAGNTQNSNISQNNHSSAIETNEVESMTSAVGTALSPVSNLATENNRSAGNSSNILTSALNRKVSNFDTPPATPEATPMSIGNSPTFKQQQAIHGGTPQPQQALSVYGNRMTHTFQQQFPTPTVESADECLFEFEGFDDLCTSSSNAIKEVASSLLQKPQQPLVVHQRQPHLQFQMHLQYPRTQQHQHNNMSDLDESDAAEEAEDALDLNSSIAVPVHKPHQSNSVAATAQMLNFAKSLPIEIANSPINDRSYIGNIAEEVQENTVDIAASIKALAKSVHGEAVFGDLPRPRLRDFHG